MSRRSAPRRIRRALLVIATALGGAAAPAVLAAQETVCDPGDVEVRSLEFSGNRAFSDAELADVIVNTQSNWLRRHLRVIGTRRCLDRGELPRDVLRLMLFYRNHGYQEVAVDTSLRAAGRGAVELEFRVTEGKPTLLTSVTVSGLTGVRDSARIARNLPLRTGRPFDRGLVEATKDTIARRLRNSGYPEASVLRSYEVDREARTATASYDVIAGPFARFGPVRVEIEPLEPGKEPELSPRTVRRAAGLREGTTYRESSLETAKRNLYQSEAYQHVEVLRDTVVTPDSVVPVVVSVQENFMHAARVGAGWGTLDCFRAQGAFVDRDFLNGRGRLELNGRVSKIGIGKPFDVDDGVLCPSDLRSDPYSDTLNYYAGATLRQPVIFGLRMIPTLTLYSERRSEFKAFLRTIPIGGVASFDLPRRRGVPAMTLAYQLERGRTSAEPALFCAVFNLCTAADQSRVQEFQRLAVASWAMTRDRTDNPLEPMRGSVTRLEFRHASREIGSSEGLEFNRLTGDASWYRKVGDVTVAARLRAGGVTGRRLRLNDTADFFVPPSERLYAGGPNSVRGFRQNELGPAVYVVSNFTAVDVDGGDSLFYLRPDPQNPRGFERAVPTGGNSMLVGTLEFRIKSPVLTELLQWAAFGDFGQVWNRGDSLVFAIRDLRVTPGVGFRIFSPIGAIRVDVGYNPYRRPLGAAYYDAPLRGATAPLYCVSPGNTLVARRLPPEPGAEDQEPVYLQESGACPGGFQPEHNEGFFRRLTFNFSIGQAF